MTECGDPRIEFNLGQSESMNVGSNTAHGLINLSNHVCQVHQSYFEPFVEPIPPISKLDTIFDDLAALPGREIVEVMVLSFPWHTSCHGSMTWVWTSTKVGRTLDHACRTPHGKMPVDCHHETTLAPSEQADCHFGPFVGGCNHISPLRHYADRYSAQRSMFQVLLFWP